MSHVLQIAVRLHRAEPAELIFAHVAGMVMINVIAGGRSYGGCDDALPVNTGAASGIVFIVFPGSFPGFAATSSRKCMRWPMLLCFRALGYDAPFVYTCARLRRRSF